MTTDGVQTWAIPTPGGWQLITATHQHGRYTEQLLTGTLTATQALTKLKQAKETQ